MSASASLKINLKRAYEAAAASDGKRLLVERLWPRGVAREKAQIARWFKELAPSPELRKWYAHEPARWPAFQDRYRAELDDLAHSEEMAELIALCRSGTVTFVYAARDEERNSARLLRQYVIELLEGRA